MESSSGHVELDNKNSDSGAPSAAAGARLSGILPAEVTEKAAQHRVSRGRNSLPWSRPTASPRGSALWASDIKRRSLSSMASVCNAATIQIPDFVPAGRLSMESTCSNVRASFSGLPSTVDFMADGDDEVDATVGGFETAVWNLLQAVLQNITYEYAQRLAILQSETNPVPMHSSEDSSRASVAVVPHDAAEQEAAAPAASPLSLPIESKRSGSKSALKHPVQVADSGAAEGETPMSSAGTSPAKSSRANHKKFKRAASAPALPDDGEDDSKQVSEPRKGSAADKPFREAPSNNSVHSANGSESALSRHEPLAVFHHAHLEVHHGSHLELPKNFVSSACSSARSSIYHPGEELTCLSTRSSARGSMVTRGLRNFELLSGQAAHHHKDHHWNRGHDPISAIHVNNMAHNMLGASHTLGNSLEAELDAVLAASNNVSPYRHRGSFYEDSPATKSRNMRDSVGSSAAPSPRNTKPPVGRNSMEREMDAHMDMLVERGGIDDHHDEAFPHMVSTHAPPPLPCTVTAQNGEETGEESRDLPIVSQSDMDAEERVRAMQSGGSLHSGSSRGSHNHVFEVLPLYDTRQKSLRVTQRNQTSLNFGFEGTNDSEINSDDEEDTCGMRACCRSECTLRPNSFVKIIWDMIGFVLISYDFVMIPMEFFEPTETDFLWAMAWIVRIYWTCDFPLSMISAYELQSGLLERRLGRVLLHYFKTWAIFDMLILTLDYLENAVQGLSGLGAARAGKIGKSIRLLRMFRVLRMLRRNTLPEPVKQVTYKLQSEQYQILFGIWRIIVFLLGLVHLLACCWYGIGTGSGSSWVEYYNMDEAGLDWRYTSSFHWSLTQFAGSMDLQPQNVVDRFFAIFALIIGFLVSACVVSSITSSMTRLQIVLAHESTQKSLLSNYLADNGISSKLALRVQRNAIYAFQQDKKNLPESSVELLQLVSEPLRVEVHYEMYMPVLTAHPFFQLYNQMSPSGMRNLCHGAVCRIQLALGDVLFTAGETPQTPWMYFLTSGMMQYFQEQEAQTGLKGGKPTSVPEGQWACEPVLWTPWIHHGTMRAKTEIILMGLRAGNFQDIVCRFQSREFTPKSYAEEYVGHLNQVDVNELTDLAESKDDILEYCQKAIDKCAFRIDPSKMSKRSIASSSLESRGERSTGCESRLADLNETVSTMKNATSRSSKKSVASSVVSSMFRLGRSSTARSLSVYSNRSTTRSTTRSAKSKLLSRTKSRLSQSPMSSNQSQTTFTGLDTEGETRQQSSEPQSATKPFVIDSEDDLGLS